MVEIMDSLKNFCIIFVAVSNYMCLYFMFLKMPVTFCSLCSLHFPLQERKVPVCQISMFYFVFVCLLFFICKCVCWL